MTRPPECSVVVVRAYQFSCQIVAILDLYFWLLVQRKSYFEGKRKSIFSSCYEMYVHKTQGKVSLWNMFHFSRCGQATQGKWALISWVDYRLNNRSREDAFLSHFDAESALWVRFNCHSKSLNAGKQMPTKQQVAYACIHGECTPSSRDIWGVSLWENVFHD